MSHLIRKSKNICTSDTFQHLPNKKELYFMPHAWPQAIMKGQSKEFGIKYRTHQSGKITANLKWVKSIQRKKGKNQVQICIWAQEVRKSDKEVYVFQLCIGRQCLNEWCQAKSYSFNAFTIREGNASCLLVEFRHLQNQVDWAFSIQGKEKGKREFCFCEHS